MRCIEMNREKKAWKYIVTINRNMRCIEIRLKLSEMCMKMRLIETWDVLKSWQVEEKKSCGCRLIETWDVLKCNIMRGVDVLDKINRNMRCIEMRPFLFF